MKKYLSMADIITHYSMSRHPEGGWYKRTYQSDGVIAAECLPGFKGARHYSTAILYLLPGGEKSALHRIKQDETWHFYLGSGLRLVMITPQGEHREIVLGPSITAGEFLQYTVPAGHWFGAMPLESSEWSLVGCTVAPGFDFADFELGRTGKLIELFPEHKELILEFGVDMS